MTNDMQATPHFVAAAEAKGSFWRRPSDRDALGDLPFVVLSSTELLASAHQLPIMVRLSEDYRVTVIGILDETVLASSPFAPETGRYLRAYMPIALRTLPFRLHPVSGTLEVEERALRRDADAGAPLHDAGGALAKPVADTQRLMERTRAGMDQLSKAAQLLFASGLLSPLIASDAAPDWLHRCYTVDTDAYAALQPLQVIGIGGGSFLAFDLATSCIFSRRLLQPQYRAVLTREQDVAPGQLSADIVDQLVRNLGRLEFSLDEGVMIEVDRLTLAAQE